MIQNYIRNLSLAQVPVIHPAIFYDDCSGTFTYIITGNAGDYVAQYNTIFAHSGLKGIKLATRATGPLTGDWVTITKNLWTPPTKLLRLQLLSANAMVYNTAELYTYLYWYDGANEHMAGIRLRHVQNDISYFNSSAAWTPIPAIAFNPSYKVWHHLDISLDLSTNTYWHLAFDHNVADLSEISFATTPSATKPYLTLVITAKATTDAKASLMIDHILLTPETP